MGTKQSSLKEVIEHEEEVIDAAHNDLFEKFEYSLREARNANLREFKEFDQQINRFIKANLVESYEQFEHGLQHLLEIAKADKLKDCSRYEEIYFGWRELVVKLDIPSVNKTSLLGCMDCILNKQKQISSFEYEKETLSALETALYDEKLLRDNCYKELLIGIAGVIKSTNQLLHQKYSGSTYKIENEVSLKDKEFVHLNGVNFFTNLISYLINHQWLK